MPIRKERKHLYPANWKTEIVPAVRARSGDCCEICKVRNGAMIKRGAGCAKDVLEWWQYVDQTQFIYNALRYGKFEYGPNWRVTWRAPIRIILTVAHLNHDETDNRMENLAHLCQLHHNRHDATHRAATRKSRSSLLPLAGEGGANAPDEGTPC